MIEINIEQAHGYLRDSDGKTIQRFVNWKTGTKQVHPATEIVEYVEDASSLDEQIHPDYKPDLNDV